MKIAQILLAMMLSFTAILAMADVQAISGGSREETVANLANNIFSVTTLRVGKLAYKVVTMDSGLNGDLNVTTIVLVAESEVGGAAGYESAFQLTPKGDLQDLKSASVENDSLALVFSGLDGQEVKKLYRYDAPSKTLKEIPGK